MSSIELPSAGNFPHWTVTEKYESHLSLLSQEGTWSVALQCFCEGCLKGKDTEDCVLDGREKLYPLNVHVLNLEWVQYFHMKFHFHSHHYSKALPILKQRWFSHWGLNVFLHLVQWCDAYINRIDKKTNHHLKRPLYFSGFPWLQKRITINTVDSLLMATKATVNAGCLSFS